MSNTQVFDEASNRINKTVIKRPDSGIHNSMELSGDHEKGKKSTEAEQHDSGRESDQPEVVQKKSGFIKSIKKMFKSKKKDKMGKRSKSQDNLDSQYKAHSVPDMLAHTGAAHDIQRYNSDKSKQNEKKDGQGASTDFVDVDDDENKEKKTPLKDAQQYIRSSLRKFKNKRKKSAGSDSPNSVVKIPDKGDGSKDKSLEPVDNTDFFNSPSAAQPAVMTHTSINLSDITSQTPKIETSAAKDRIRIAPQNRRLPSKYRSPPPSSTHSSSLRKINENENAGIFSTQSDSSWRKSESDKSVSVNGELKEEKPKKKAPPKPARRNLVTKSTEDLTTTPRDSAAQRSASTNSRENVSNKSEKPVPKPRSNVSSSSSLDKNESLRSYSGSRGVFNDNFPNVFRDRNDSTGKSISSVNEETGTKVDDKFPFRNKKKSYDEIEKIKVSKSSSYEDESSFKRNSAETSLGSSKERFSWIKNSENDFENEKVVNGGNIDQRRFGNTSPDAKNNDSSMNKNEKDFSWIKTEEGATETSKKFQRSFDDIFHNFQQENDSKKNDLPKKLHRNDKQSLYFKSTGDLSDKTESPFNRYKDREFRKSTEDVSWMKKDQILKRSKEEISRTNSDDSKNPEKKQSHYPVTAKNSYGETTFALTSPRKDLELPSDFIGKHVSKNKDINEHSNHVSGNEAPHKEGSSIKRAERPQSVKIRSSEITELSNAVLLSSSNSNEKIKDLGKSMQPERKPKPVVSPKKLKPLTSPKGDAPESSDVLAFSRKSLKKVVKTDDFSGKQDGESSATSSFENIPSPNTEESKLSDSFMRKQKSEEKEVEIDSGKSTGLRKISLKKIQQVDAYHQQSREGEPNEESSVPAFNRLSLKKVPKRDDFVGKEEDKQTAENKEKEKDVKPLPFENRFKLRNDFEHGKVRTGSLKASPPKHLVVNNPKSDAGSFSFQSQDISDRNRSQSLSTAEAKKMRQGMSPTEEEKKVPDWIKMAKMKQRNNESETTSDSKEKGQASPKPVTSPKPKPSPKPDPSRTVASTPNSTKSMKLPNTPQLTTPSRASHSFNAQTDVSKNQCIVCGKTVYMVERCEVDHHILHKACAKCTICSRKLNVGGIFVHDEKVYCSQHKQ